MSSFVSILIDLIIVAIILIVTLISAKQGFVRTLISVVGFVAAVIIAFNVSGPLANTTYDKYIEPALVDTVSQSINDTANATADQIWQGLPPFLTNNAEKFNISKDSLDGLITKNGNVSDTVGNVSQTAVKPILTEIIKTLYAVILIVVLLFAVKLLAKFLNKLFSFSLVGKLNTALGGVIGLIKGTVIAVIVCEIIILLISITPNGIWIFNNQNIASTVIFKFLSNIF